MFLALPSNNRLARVQHSSLFLTFLNYGRKKFYSIGTWTPCCACSAVVFAFRGAPLVVADAAAVVVAVAAAVVVAAAAERGVEKRARMNRRV
jgi:hypothetical protein